MAEIKNITGLVPALPKGQPILTGPGKLATEYWSVNQSGPVYTGNIPGSTCVWIDVHPPSSDTLYQEPAIVNVGYGESATNWSVLAKQYKASTYFDYVGIARCSTLNVGHGSQAFLETVDLWEYYNITGPATALGVPHYMDAITSLTEHHDILQVAFLNASLTKTVDLVDEILVNDPSF